MKEIVAATGNRGKIAEFTATLTPLGYVVRPVTDFGSIAEPEETGATFADNAILKARYYADLTGRPCLADDSGLEVDALGGEPGVYSARYAGENATDAANNAKLLNELSRRGDEARSARFRCVLALCQSDGSVLTSDGTCEGVILFEGRGDGGFGYDPLFFLPEHGKTLAEMTLEEKNSVSHRGRALAALVVKLGSEVT